MTMQPGRRALAVYSALISGACTALAQTISVPNGDFGSPTTGFVSTVVDDWSKPAQPGYFDPGTYGFSWSQTSGIFANTAAGTYNHIDNLNGTQAAYVLAFPGAGFFQDLATPGATFQPGLSYTLSAGVIGEGLSNGDTLVLSLYYRDGGNSIVPVQSTTVTYDTVTLSSITHLTGFSVQVPAVGASDAWAGKPIGVEISVGAGEGAGDWDVSNVSLVSSVPEPVSMGLTALGLGAIAAIRSGRRRQG